MSGRLSLQPKSQRASLAASSTPATANTNVANNMHVHAALPALAPSVPLPTHSASAFARQFGTLVPVSELALVGIRPPVAQARPLNTTHVAGHPAAMRRAHFEEMCDDDMDSVGHLERSLLGKRARPDGGDNDDDDEKAH